MLWLIAMLCGRAEAAPHGLVVHLNLSAAVDGLVVVQLSGEGEQKDVPMKDDGTSPDVTAGDHVYSGTTLVQIDTVKVGLQLGDRKIEGGSVSWAATQNTCDLNLTLDGENLSAEAAVPAPPVPQQPTDATTSPASPATGPSSTTTLQPLPQGSTGAAPPSTADNTASFSMIAGAAVLLLAGLLYLGWSGSGGGSLVPPLPEPGLLGPLTPSLSEGLSRWTVAPEDASQLTKILLATLARQHRVLLLAPPDFQPDPVFGGPAYRARSKAWKKMLTQLLEEGGLPLAVLCLDSGLAGDLGRTLPDGVGGILVGGDGGKMPVVRCQRDGERWHLQSDTGMLLVVGSARGFEQET